MAGRNVETAKEVAFSLFNQGKRPSDPEVKDLGVKPKTLYNYYQQWKKTTSGSSSGTTTVPKGSKGIEVGKITIAPENWAVTQYGAILIMDTYEKAKRDLNYGGTIGEFLCDICEFYRRIQGYYKETK